MKGDNVGGYKPLGKSGNTALEPSSTLVGCPCLLRFHSSPRRRLKCHHESAVAAAVSILTKPSFPCGALCVLCIVLVFCVCVCDRLINL